MAQVLEDFLKKTEQMPKSELQALMGWSDETMKAKMARREVPRFRRIKNLVLFSYEDVAVWLDQNSKNNLSKVRSVSDADLLGVSSLK